MSLLPEEEKKPGFKHRDLRIVVRSVRELRKSHAALTGRVNDVESRVENLEGGELPAPVKASPAALAVPDKAKEKEMSPQAIAAAVVNLMIGLIYLAIEIAKAFKKL